MPERRTLWMWAVIPITVLLACSPRGVENAAARSRVRLELPGWTELPSSGPLVRTWQHKSGAVLSLAEGDSASNVDLAGFRNVARHIASRKGGGLLEAERVSGRSGDVWVMTYKVLLRPAYRFTGMVFVEYSGHPFIWAVVDGERGVTGLREATVTTELGRAGQLTLEGYKAAWHDPYEPGFDGVDRSCMRFISDDPRYDKRFPDHPLSRVREIQRWLVSSPNAEAIAREAVG